jgi:hypothetical protein
MTPDCARCRAGTRVRPRARFSSSHRVEAPPPEIRSCRGRPTTSRLPVSSARRSPRLEEPRSRCMPARRARDRVVGNSGGLVDRLLPCRPQPLQVGHGGGRSSSTASAGRGPSPSPAQARQALERQRRSGGQWFYWIAGLTLVNAVAGFAGQDWRFILGLGVTQIVQELAKSGSDGTKAGLRDPRAARRPGQGWAFVLGMTLYALDGAIFVLIQDWAGAAFHAFALLMITRGYVASRRLSAPGA